MFSSWRKHGTRCHFSPMAICTENHFMWPLCIFWIRAKTKTVIILITERAIQWRIQDFPDGGIPAEFGAKTYIYRPQRSCGKVMFSQASVILSTGDVAETPLGRHPPGRHPLCPVHAGINSPPPPMATAVDGTHPTGMHSCSASLCRKLHEYEWNWTLASPPTRSANEHWGFSTFLLMSTHRRPPSPWTEWLTDACETLPSRSFVGGR